MLSRQGYKSNFVTEGCSEGREGSKGESPGQVNCTGCSLANQSAASFRAPCGKGSRTTDQAGEPGALKTSGRIRAPPASFPDTLPLVAKRNRRRGYEPVHTHALSKFPQIKERVTGESVRAQAGLKREPMGREKGVDW